VILSQRRGDQDFFGCFVEENQGFSLWKLYEIYVARVKFALLNTSRMPKKPLKNSAFMKPVTPDEKLAAVVGATPLPRTELTKKLWIYIKKHGLQDKKNKRNINADDKLKPVFNGRGTVSMFEMTKLVSGHLK
jgi:chromatin remodeling complex protein RSC6